MLSPPVLARRLLLSSSIRRAGMHGLHQPNAPLDLDPSLQRLLRDTDMAINRQRSLESTRPRELESWPVDGSSERIDDEVPLEHGREKRLSPAAYLGGDRIGAVVLPDELQRSVAQLINEADRYLLRSDAKRVFLTDSPASSHSNTWTTRTPTYSSRKKERILGPRDGLAFAAVAMPDHFAAISAVLHELKSRVKDWSAQSIVDFGAHSGSALWAALNAFQLKTSTSDPDVALANTAVRRFACLENRSGISTMAQELLKGISVGNCEVSFNKFWNEVKNREEFGGQNSLVISAFNLAELPTDLARKQMVKEMWDVGSEFIIIMDHGGKEGFECVARAREQLLKLGRKEAEHGQVGNHVVAPCPHDHECPMLSTRHACQFAQRLQRPPFLRRTKHAKAGQETASYSYVVIRRGKRPTAEQTNIGRERPVDHDGQPSEETSRGLSLDKEAIVSILQQEAYAWPRIVHSPKKRSGHIILEVCSSEGRLESHTIPKSQGKQAYYDARKSSWGDIFPHPPKNGPVLISKKRATTSDEEDEVTELLASLASPPKGRMARARDRKPRA